MHAEYWRNLSAEGVNKNKKILTDGIRYLDRSANDKGKWKKFPFFYILLALNDIDLPDAKKEINYAAGVCQKYLYRKKETLLATYEKRKKEIARRSLEIIWENFN